MQLEVWDVHSRGLKEIYMVALTLSRRTIILGVVDLSFIIYICEINDPLGISHCFSNLQLHNFCVSDPNIIH